MTRGDKMRTFHSMKERAAKEREEPNPWNRSVMIFDLDDPGTGLGQ